MSHYQIPYGDSVLDIDLPTEFDVDWIEPVDTPAVPDPLSCIREALENPVNMRRLTDFGKPTSAAIAINDKTRPVPHEFLLPPLLDTLVEMGISPHAITLIVASGTHLPMTPDEFPKIVPQEIVERYRIVAHDCDDSTNLVDIGTTTRGTPVRINRQFIGADLRIVVGNTDPHHFMGYSGGAKTAVIGLGGRETINRNHAMLTDPNSRTGTFLENPMRMDVEEMGQMAGLHYALNAILNMDKQIVQAFAGDPRQVMDAGIPVVRQVCQVKVPHDYDLVIASPGGYPKDINFYQSQKALTHASLITRPGGTVLLVAACPEAIGSTGYEKWMEGMESFGAVLQRFQTEGFQVGPHKAFLVARIASRIKVFLYSQIPAEKVRKLLLTPAASVNVALAQVSSLTEQKPKVAILPYGTSTVPYLA